jgi:hypothetical protein
MTELESMQRDEQREDDEYGKQLRQERAAEFREEIVGLAQAFNMAMAVLSKALGQIVQAIAPAIKSFCLLFKQRGIPPGLKRWAKREELAHYESISEGKSNNWRKYHGLALRRAKR